MSAASGTGVSLCAPTNESIIEEVKGADSESIGAERPKADQEEN